MTTFYFNPFALISFSSFLIMIILAILVWHKYYTAQTKYVVYLFVANAIYSFFYTFEISLKTIREIIYYYHMEYLGIPFLATYYFMFALHYSGKNSWLTLRKKLLLFAIPVITMLMVFTNEYHHLFYSKERIISSGPFPVFSFTPGIWYYVHQGYVIFIMILSLAILWKMVKGSVLIYKRQLWYLLLATTFPFIGYLAYQLHLIPFAIDPVSFTFTLTGIVVYMALTRVKLFDLVPIARTRLFEEIQDGVLLFDLNNRMVDFNQTVCNQFKITKKDLGKTTHELLDRWPEMLQFVENNQKGRLELLHVDSGKTFYYNIQIMELENSKNVKQGKLVVIRDVSDLIKSERERNFAANRLDAVINANVGSAVAGTGGDIILTASPTVTTSYYVNATQQPPYNCPKKLNNTNYTVTVNPNAAITAMTSTICNGGTFTVTPVNGTNGVVPAGTTYTWSAPVLSPAASITGGSSQGTGQSSISQTLTNVTANVATATYTVTPQTGSCTGATFTVTVTVNPTAVITSASTKTICDNVALGYTATSSTTGATFAWTRAVVAGIANGIGSGATASINEQLDNTTSSAVNVTYIITPTIGTCAGTPFTLTVTVNPTASIASVTGTAALCVGSTATYTANSVVLGGTGTGAWSSSNAAIATVDASGLVTGVTAGTCNIIYTITGGCGGNPSAQQSVTISALPSATISYAGSPFCRNAGIISVTRTGTAGGTYSAAPAGLSINASTGAITTTTSSVNTYTVSYTMAAAGGCGAVVATTSVEIKQDGSWNGSTNGDWNTATNWECSAIPTSTTNVLISNGKPNYPTLSSGAVGAVNNLTIQNTSSLTVAGNKLQIAGTITNSGTFTASAGTIEFNGTVAQTIPAAVFASNELDNLIINNAAGVTLGGTLKITGILDAATGNLAAGNFLTLISSTAQTALIDGSGAGQVTGNVVMQRYLPSGYGYKYLSSPFSDATVAQLSGYLSTTATISTFYLYNENKTVAGADVTGWTAYPAGLLNILQGYAANLGAGPATKTIALTGTVNNGPYSVALKNNNRTFTKGFNLVGNPYPSPIDWDAAGWTKTNIDNAIYFFDSSSGADEYAGVYCSYVGGVSSGGSTNLIPSMQGFFVHVSDAPLPYPVSGTLGMTNSVRTNDLNPAFKAATSDPRPILRFEAGLEGKSTLKDAFVIYFDPQAKLNFDKEKDALKLMNTDATVPNIYSITPDARQLSINGMPVPTDSLTKIPLGIKTLKDGWVNFNAKDISALPYGLKLYLQDKEMNVIQNLAINPSYRFYLQQGEYNQRFTLIFTRKEFSNQPAQSEKLFSIIRLDKKVMVKINLPGNEEGKLLVSSISGLISLEKSVTNLQMVDISSGVKNGIYVVTMTSGVRKQAEKTIIMY